MIIQIFKHIAVIVIIMKDFVVSAASTPTFHPTTDSICSSLSSNTSTAPSVLSQNSAITSGIENIHSASHNNTVKVIIYLN